MNAESLESRYFLAGQWFAAEGPAVGDITPVGVAAADFNADGKSDLAVCSANSSGSGLLSIHLGRGNGTFDSPYSPRKINLLRTPKAVAVGDFDSDGRPDLAVTGQEGLNGSVVIYRNTGGATFSVGQSYTVGTMPNAIEISDFNQDGKPDLAVANRGLGVAGSVSILINQGGGYFGTPVTALQSAYVRDVAARDINADGQVDLILATDQGGNLRAMLGRGNGTFAEPVVVAPDTDFLSVVARDFNGDGKTDLAATHEQDAKLVVYLGTGNGSFDGGTIFDTGAPAVDIVVADFNNDGKPDVVTANDYGKSFTALTNLGSGTFRAKTYPSGSWARSVTAADFDADGNADLAVASWLSGVAPVFTGRGDGTFVAGLASPMTGTNTPVINSTVSADFNRDGVLDLAVANVDDGSGTTTASLAVRLGLGDGTFASPSTLYAVGRSAKLVTGDFNGDGIRDLAAASGASGTVHALLGNGDGSFQAPIRTSISSGSISISAADFNSDGKTDLIQSINGTLTWLRSSGNGRFTRFFIGSSSFSTVTSVVTADFDRDGFSDFAFRDSYTNSLVVTLGNGDGTFDAPIVHTSVTADMLVAADFSGDGVLDLVAGSTQNGSFVPFFGAGNGTFNRQSTVTSAFSIFALDFKTADFDGDGKSDLAVLGQGMVSVYAAAGTIFPPTPRCVATDSGTTSLAVADFNGDGRPDLLATTSSSATVFPYLTPVMASGLTVNQGVLTITAEQAVLAQAANDLVFMTGAGTTRIAPDALTRIVFNGKAATVKADLGKLAGNAIGLVVMDGASVTFTTAQHLGTVENAGSMVLAAGESRFIRATALTSSTDATLDLNNNALIYDYATPAGQAATVRNWIGNAYGLGTWTGSGLTSSSARNDATGHTTLNFMEASEYKSIYGTTATFAGEQIDDTAVLVKYTTYGDSNFDGKTDFNDFLNLQNAFGQSNKTSFGGDFDYSGTTDFNDFLVLQNHFGASLPVATPAVKPPPVATASISGVAFNDSNRNGKYDKGDSLAAGKTVWLDLDDDGVKDASEPSAVTDAKGRYAFKNLAAGTYHVRRALPTGYRESTKPLLITLTRGQSVTDIGIGSKTA